MAPRPSASSPRPLLTLLLVATSLTLAHGQFRRTSSQLRPQSRLTSQQMMQLQDRRLPPSSRGRLPSGFRSSGLSSPGLSRLQSQRGLSPLMQDDLSLRSSMPLSSRSRFAPGLSSRLSSRNGRPVIMMPRSRSALLQQQQQQQARDQGSRPAQPSQTAEAQEADPRTAENTRTRTAVGAQSAFRPASAVPSSRGRVMTQAQYQELLRRQQQQQQQQQRIDPRLESRMPSRTSSRMSVGRSPSKLSSSAAAMHIKQQQERIREMESRLQQLNRQLQATQAAPLSRDPTPLSRGPMTARDPRMTLRENLSRGSAPLSRGSAPLSRGSAPLGRMNPNIVSVRRMPQGPAFLPGSNLVQGRPGMLPTRIITSRPGAQRGMQDNLVDPMTSAKDAKAARDSANALANDVLGPAKVEAPLDPNSPKAPAPAKASGNGQLPVDLAGQPASPAVAGETQTSVDPSGAEPIDPSEAAENAQHPLMGLEQYVMPVQAMMPGVMPGMMPVMPMAGNFQYVLM